MNCSDVNKKRAATAKMSEAVISFFTNNFSKGCKSTDEAISILEGRKPRPEDAFEIRLTKRVCEKGQGGRVQYGWVYAPEPNSQPITFKCDGKLVTLKPDDLPQSLDLIAQTEDLTLIDGTWRRGEFGSQVVFSGLDFGRAHSNSPKPLVRDMLEFLEAQKKEGAGEVQISFRNFREDLHHAEGGDLSMMSQIWKANYEGTILRSTVPKRAVKQVTLVVGLHGAGGSENFFFEAYGRGLGPKLATERGWMFVAPRTSGKAVERSVAFVESTFKVKVTKLLVMGHSMGGGTAIGFSNAELPLKAVALFAPAGTKLSPTVAKVPTYLAVGKQDLAMLTASAMTLKPQVLATPGGIFKEFDPSEHTMIVPDAIREAYAFFDKVLKR
jgi:pimeloyl-ACP methyl ester carboxylesterase